MTRRATKVAFSILDQGLASLAPFIVGVIVARVCTLTEFGLYSMAYALVLLLVLLHQGYVIEPMLTRRNAQLEERNILREIHLPFVGIVGALAAVVLVVFVLAGGPWTTVMASALAFGSMSTFIFARRAAYARGNPGQAAIFSAGYLIISSFFMLGFAQLNMLSSTTAMCGLAVAAFLASLPEILRIGNTTKSNLEARELRKFHWTVGQWLIAASLLSWVPINSFFVLVPSLTAIEQGAELRAIYNLVLPAQLAFGNLSFLVIPAVARRADDRDALFKLARQASLGIVGLALSYGMLISVVAKPMLHSLYAGKFDTFASALAVFAFLPVFTGLHMVLSSCLKGLLDTRGNLYTVAIGSAIALLLLPLVLVNAVLGSILAMFVAFAAMNLFLVMRLRKNLSTWGSAHG